MAALFFPSYGFVPQGFPGKVFNEAAQNTYTKMMYSFSLRYDFIPLDFPSNIWLTVKGECYETMTANFTVQY